MRYRLVWLVLCLAPYLGPSAFANLFLLFDQGNTPAPWPVDEPEVVMASETVRIEEGEDLLGFRAHCTFVLRSTANKPAERTAAFPVVDLRNAETMEKHFKVTVDGEPVAVKLEETPKPKTPRPDPTSGMPLRPPPPHYPARLVWGMTWP
ncbi:MAG TPA: hypothetical protein VNE39_22900, partial [Planctomycetota bacterium]|nr:hypothetical protein [Planctomycetota bacterium]